MGKESRFKGVHTVHGTLTVATARPKLNWYFQDASPNRKACRAMKAWNRSTRKRGAALLDVSRRPPGSSHYFNPQAHNLNLT